MGVCKPCIEKLYLWAIILEENAQLWLKRRRFMRRKELRTRLSQMGRQVSVVRNVEHVCGRGGMERSGEQTSRIGYRDWVKAKPVTLHEIVADDEPRIDLHDAELNRVLCVWYKVLLY